MLTNEKVLAAFSQYLAADKACEVVSTSRGYTFMKWNAARQEWCDVRLCPTPASLRDVLLEAYCGYLAFQCLEEEQDDPTPIQWEEIRRQCEAMYECCQ